MKTWRQCNGDVKFDGIDDNDNMKFDRIDNRDDVKFDGIDDNDMITMWSLMGLMMNKNIKTM